MSGHGCDVAMRRIGPQPELLRKGTANGRY